MNEIETNLNSNSDSIATNTKVNSELLASLQSVAPSSESIAIYEAELLEVSQRVIKGDLSDMEAILSSQIVNLNNLFTKFANRADSHAIEGHVNEAERFSRMAMACTDKTMKGVAQLTKMKAPKKGSVYIRTLNQQNTQNNNSQIPTQF
ncbi:MAG: hypothetical protein V3U87_08565 [Methylococcaceae bacterium]